MDRKRIIYLYFVVNILIMRLVKPSNVLYNNLNIAQKKKEIKQFKFILHNNNIKITNTIELQKFITI